MDLLENFFKFIKTQRLPLNGHSPVLLTVSGGLDSMVMAHLFYKANIPFAIAHCNFQLRGPESDADELFVQQVALDFEVPFFIKRFETKLYATNKGLSTQMAARELRYAWFAQIATENGFAQVCTAHHLNDTVETALLNFARGTGLPGLIGIAPVSGLLVRPMLFAERKEILEYSRQHEITWREDSSNESDDYARNFVRHHIVPRLEELNPNFLNTAARNMGRIAEAEANLTFLLNHWLNTDSLGSNQALKNQSIAIEKQKLAQLPAPNQALRQWLKPHGFNAEQARQIAENLDHVGLELHSETGAKLLIDRDKIIISLPNNVPDTAESATRDQPSIPVHEDDLMLALPDGTRLFMMPQVHFNPPAHDSNPDRPHNDESAFVDAEKLKFPLHLRHWLPGDAFQPFGMGGKSQKLQDFFTNHKLSRFEKEEVWLLVNGDDSILWVLGWRLDERFKIQSNTTKVLKFNWIK